MTRKGYAVQGWMWEAGLKGIALHVYACLYSWGGGAVPTGDLAEATGHDRRYVMNAVKELQEAGLLDVTEQRGAAYIYKVNPIPKGTPYQKVPPTKRRGVTLYQKEGGTPFKNNQRLSNNNNSLSHTPSACAREGEKTGWADEAKARRTLEALDNGGSVRDNIVRSLMRSGELTRDKLYQLYYTFEAMQRNEESSHTSDGDYRGHFVKWATIQLKEEARQAHVDAKMEERSRANRQTSWERRDEAERNHMEELARAAAARYEREKAESERNKIN